MCKLNYAGNAPILITKYTWIAWTRMRRPDWRAERRRRQGQRYAGTGRRTWPRAAASGSASWWRSTRRTSVAGTAGVEARPPPPQRKGLTALARGPSVASPPLPRLPLPSQDSGWGHGSGKNKQKSVVIIGGFVWIIGIRMDTAGRRARDDSIHRPS